MKIVISLGGSLITGSFTAEKISAYAGAILAIGKTSEKLVIVTGGGRLAREYIRVVKDLGMDSAAQDMMAISLTHVNAKLISLALNHASRGIANEVIPRTEDEIKQMLSKSALLVCGGTIPGQSTDSVAAKIARDIGADLLINASDIDGVYDRDPKKNSGAKKYRTLTYDKFSDIIGSNEQSPGKYALFDCQAISIIKEKNIPAVMIDARDPKELIRAKEGTHSGTRIG